MISYKNEKETTLRVFTLFGVGLLIVTSITLHEYLEDHDNFHNSCTFPMGFA